MTLREQAAALFTHAHDQAKKRQYFLNDGDLLLFLEAIIPILEREEQREKGFGVLEGELEECDRKARRAEVLAQMGASLYGFLKAEHITGYRSERRKLALDEAEEILKEAEARVG